MSLKFYLLFQLFYSCDWSEASKITILPKCSNYSNSVYQNSPEIFIPASVTSGIAYNEQTHKEGLTFHLTDSVELKCDHIKSTRRNISLSSKQNPVSQLHPRNFFNYEAGTGENHLRSYFTSSGYFYDHNSGIYYRPDGDYCVDSYSDTDIILRICTVSSDCTHSVFLNGKTWCLPKCCAIDEVLLYWRKQCVQLAETEGVTPWIPAIFNGPKYPNTKIAQSVVSKNMLFRMVQLPKHCPIRIKDTQIVTFRQATGADVEHPFDPTLAKQKDPIKLSVPVNEKSGLIQPMAFNLQRRSWWIPNLGLGDFCVDGFHFKPQNNSTIYTGNETNFVVFYCGEEETTNSKWITYTYIGVSVVSLFFLGVTIAIYTALWKHQNLHGLTIICYTVAMFGSYLFLTIAHVSSLYPNPPGEQAYKNGRRFECFLNAVLAHYFFLTSYLWLTVMNYDMWLAFRSLRIVQRDSKEWSKFQLYSAVAWILPLLLIIAFIVVNETYRDSTTEVPVPGYGESSCFVSSFFRGQYVYAPMGLMMGVNLILLAMTMHRFFSMKKNASRTFTNEVANANRYSSKLFIKLFIVMGGTSFVDFVSWYYNNKEHKHWIFVVLESISYLTPIALFVIFCGTSRVLNQLRENYPGFMGKLDSILNTFKKCNADKQYDNSEEHSDDTKKSTLDRQAEKLPLKTFNK